MSSEYHETPLPPEAAGLSETDESYQRYRHEDRSLGEIASDLLDNASTLIRQEVELAKAEAKDAAGKAGKGIGMLVGAAIAGFLALIALTLMLWWAIAVLIGGDNPALGWSGLIVTVIWLVVAGVLVVVLAWLWKDWVPPWQAVVARVCTIPLPQAGKARDGEAGPG